MIDNISKYNFIFGKTGSGKTLISCYLASIFELPLVSFMDIDSGDVVKALSNKFLSVTLHSIDHRIDYLTNISSIVDVINNIEIPSNIIIDDMSNLTFNIRNKNDFKSPKHDTNLLLDRLPGKHRYFFTMQIMNNDGISAPRFGFLQHSLNEIKRDSSVFRISKENSEFILLNNLSKEEYNLGDINRVNEDIIRRYIRHYRNSQINKVIDE